MSDISDLKAILEDRTRDSHTRVLAGDALRYAYLREEDVEQADKAALRVIGLGQTLLEGSKEVYDAVGRAHITRAPRNLHDFLIALEWDRDAASRFYQPRQMVLREAVDALTDMMVNDIYDAVLLSSPPRVGKSSLGLFFVSWCVGRSCDSPILMTGYAEKITKMFHGGLSEIYNDSEYNYRAIFPNLDLVNTSADDLTLDFRDDGKTQTRKYKSVTCRAIDGSLTGATEARQLLYCDDLVRDIEEALNINRLEMLKTKMVTNVYSRKKEGCKELHIGTRWSVHDPLGWVEKQYEGDPRCKVIRIPALDPDTDESNFDYPFGVGFSTDYYRALREREDDVTWQCVYQQQPIEREGLLFPAEDLKYLYATFDAEFLANNPPDDIFAFCDVAFGGSDYLAMPIAYQWGDDPPIIADVVFMRGDYKLTEPVVAGRLMSHGVRRAVFEANNGGDFYSRDIDKLLREAGYKMFLVAQRAPSNKSKETRIVQHSPAIKTFTFMSPKTEGLSQEYRAFLNHLTTYTATGKNPNDDAPDSLAGLASMMRANLNATVKFYDRSHI